MRQSLRSARLDGADSAVSSSAVMSSNARPSRSRPALSRRAISRSSGESIIVASSASSAGSRSPRCLPLPVELVLHLEAVSCSSAWVSAEPPKIRLWSPRVKRFWSSALSRPKPIRAARSRRGRGLDCCISVIAQWAFLVGGAGIDWRIEPAPVPDHRLGRLATRLSYRILPGPRTAPVARIATRRRKRPATVLRSAQAFLRDRAGDAIGGPDRDPPRLDLLLAEEPALAGGQARQARSSTAASRETADTSVAGHWQRVVDRPRAWLLIPSGPGFGFSQEQGFRLGVDSRPACGRLDVNDGLAAASFERAVSAPNDSSI